MKKIISSLFYTALVAIAMSSCQKGEVVQDVNSLSIGSYVTLVTAGNNIIDATNLAGSKVSASVKEYGAEQEKLIVYVTKAPQTSDRTKWKKVKEYANNGGTYNLEVSGQEIASALGAPPAPGETYVLYNQVITKDGRSFDVANTLPDLATVAQYNLRLTWNAVVVCPFVPAQAAGTYVITRDTWDGSVGELVRITSDKNTEAVAAVLYPYAEPPGITPVKITITPATGASVVAKQTYGSYVSYGPQFANMTCEGTGGFFFSCAGTFSISLTHKLADGTNYGVYPYSLKKQ